MIAPGSLFCSALMAIQNKFYTVGLFYSLNSRDTFAARNITLDFSGSVSLQTCRGASADGSTIPTMPMLSGKARRAPRSRGPCMSTSRRRLTKQ